MGYQTILVDKAPDGVMTVTLNRPEVLNAFNDAMRSEFSRLWSEVRSDDEVRAVVLAAAGDRAFCTGVDVTERLDSESPFLDREHPWAEFMAGLVTGVRDANGDLVRYVEDWHLD